MLRLYRVGSGLRTDLGRQLGWHAVPTLPNKKGGRVAAFFTLGQLINRLARQREGGEFADFAAGQRGLVGEDARDSVGRDGAYRHKPSKRATSSS